MAAAIQIESLGKRYRLGLTHAGSIRELVNRCADRLRGCSKGLETHRNNGRSANAAEGHVWALRDVSFEVPAGEAVGIIGRNGAGKSTLLKILSRITWPTEGRAVLDGRVASLLEVGTGFHPELTGRENVFLNGAILGMTKAEVRRKFDEILDFAEIEEFIDTPVKRYSSGMYVRLAFAVAAHLEPEILVVDEVLAVGDAAFQRKCLGKMDDVARQGRTVLFVSHNMGMIERLCGTSVLLTGGRMTAMGPTADITRMYLGLAAETELDWHNPVQAGAAPRITRVRLCDDAGQSLNFVTTACTPCLEIECDIPQARPDFRLAFALHDWQERAVFASSPADCDLPGPVEPGLHRYRARFPGPILMPQRYSVTVSLYSTYAESVDHRPHVLRFDVAEVASLANAVGSRVGVLQMQAQWSHKMTEVMESKIDG